MNKRGIKRLQNVAKALSDAAKNEELVKNFTMSMYGWDGLDHNDADDLPKCGTPACAAGHYAARRDLQKKFVLSADPLYNPGKVLLAKSRVRSDYDTEEFQKYFGITGKQSHSIFSINGCNYAKHPAEAAKFIRNFIKNNR